MDQTPLRLLGLGESPRSYVFELSSWNIQKRENWGATTTPPLSAECQIEILQGLILTLPRVLPLRPLSDILATFLRKKRIIYIYSDND